MKKLLILTCCLSISIVSWAALPVLDGFYSFSSGQWEQFWPVSADFDFVDAGTDSIPDSPLGTGKFIRVGVTNTAGTSFGIVTGDDTDADYSVKVQIYTPVVDASAPAIEDFWYQMIIFYRDSGGYGRLHAQFNEDTNDIASPRIRLQITNPGFAHTDAYASPTDFTHSEGWHEFQIDISGTTSDNYYDSNLLGSSDWTTDAATRTAGKFGMGGFANAAGTLTNYFAGFKAWQGTEPPDPGPPTAVDSETWSYYE